MKKLFDPKCLELAEYFLSSPQGIDPEESATLAAEIQDVIEDHFRFRVPKPQLRTAAQTPNATSTQ